MLDNVPPNVRPTPEAVVARKAQAERERKKRTPRPFVGLHDVRRREAEWLLKKRGVTPERIAMMIIDISAAIGFGDSDRLGEHLKLLGAEKDAFRIRQIRPIDRSQQDQKRLNRARKNDRRRAKRKAVTPMSIDELQSGAIMGALDPLIWRCARDIDALLTECPAFGRVTSRVSRKAIIRRAFGKLAAFGVVEVEDQMDQYGLSVYARRLSPTKELVH